MDIVDRLQALSTPARQAFVDALERDPERYDIHPLTPAQQRMWLLAQLRPDSPVYHVCWRIDLEGTLDVDALRSALAELPARHEALRTIFVPIDDEPRQLVQGPDAAALPVTVRDLTTEAAASGAEADGLAGQLAAAERRRPFDLARGPLARATVARTGNRSWMLLFSLHHIVCDAWSMRLLFDDLAELYGAHRAGCASAPAPRARFVRVAGGRDGGLSAERREQLVGYWREAVGGAPMMLDLPTDRPRPPVLDDAGDQLPFSWSAETAQRVDALSRRTRSTPFMVFLAAYQALLYRYSNQSDLLVGVPVAGRTRAETEAVVGLFVNTLPLRARLADDLTFTELLGQVRESVLAGLAHQDLPFDTLLDALGTRRETSIQPLVQVMLDVGDGDAERLELDGRPVRCVETHTGTAKFDLTLVLLPYRDRIEGRLEYRTQLFDRDRMYRMIDHLHTLLIAAADDPTQQLADLPLLSTAERSVLSRWGAGGRPAGDPRPVTDLIAAHARRTPDAPAVVDTGRSVTYRQLDEAANRLARLLQARGVGAEIPVAVCLPECAELAVAFVGVLRSGGVYLPLDPQLPADRLRHLLDDAGARVILTHGETLAALPDTAVPRIRLDAGDPTAGYPTGCPPARLRPASAAYIIYTSGSSGRPKGVVATHGGLRNLADLQAELIGVRPEDRVLAVHSIGFDVSVSELVTTLGAGAELRLVPRDDRQPGPDLARAIADHGITVADLPPVVLSAMDPGALAGLRSLTVGGEACAPDVAAAWARGREFVNAYGLTETTVTAIAGRYTGDDSSVPIGRPLTGALAYVLDSRLEPVPVGVTGELYVGGAVVARGYLRDPARTAERFVPDPFAQLPGRRMYRTGDLVRYRGDGQLEFVGRADSQVKVRGHRIELGEVEARLRACPGVQRCAVVLREDRPGDRRLVAYVVGDAGGAERLRHRLGRELPAYMVPAAFVPVPDLPVTPSGKLDVQALPAPGPDRPLLDTDWVPPQDTTEETVAGVWRGVLGVSQVGAHDNFFDLGGNSLLLAKMRARLHTTTGVDIPTVELFRHPTVAMLARFLVGGHAPVPARSDGRDQHTEDRRRAFAERARRIRDQPSKTGWA